MTNSQKAGKAIVIGGGMAGLLTSKVLSTYYEEVLIVERDDFPEKPEERPGTPQAFHPHRFTRRGAEILGRLFPGYEDDLLAKGAPTSLNKTVHQMNQYGTMVGQYPRNDIKFSRAVLEWVLRKRINEIPHVRFLPKHDVVRLVTTQDRSAVTGVQVRERGARGEEKQLTADIVFDASGRSSKLARWLEQLGYEVPVPDLLKVDLGYSTRRYKLPSRLLHLAETWDVINIAGQPANGTFAGVFSFIENQVAEVMLYRPGGHYPPVNAEEFEQSIAKLPSSTIAEILQELEPITTPRGYRVPELYRHHFERMQRWPAGLLVLGDAFCIYDPIFGQGMTVAAMEAEVLEECLREHRKSPMPHFEQQVLQKMQAVIEPAWWLNCAADLQWQGVEYVGSEPLQGILFGQKYMDLFLKHATVGGNWELYGLYWAVNTLSVSLREIMNPQLASTVLAASDEGRQLLDQLLQEYGHPLEEVWAEIVPRFVFSA
ncbi:FAD-dependent oxidoreductase [Brevibacillus sp. B_LB10_24]|uniref:FAD-dependent oxidoreductase n=1 Tax=Brevibacillus sp. B_LB10_24 TaxID=3380645 RepID=UPI0038B713F4